MDENEYISVCDLAEIEWAIKHLREISEASILERNLGSVISFLEKKRQEMRESISISNADI